MNERSGVKRLLTILAVVMAGLICAVPLLAYKAAPYAGGRRGSDWQLTVVDSGPDSVNQHELVTSGGFNFSQMPSNSTISVRFNRAGYTSSVAATDTARVHIQGIGTDSAYVDTLLKVGADATVITSRTFFMFEGAYLDTAMGGSVHIWHSTIGLGGGILDSIPRGRVDHPMAHRLFGKQHAPLLKSVLVQHQAAVDTLHFEVRYWPNLAKYRTLTQRQGGRDGYQVLASGIFTAANPQEVFLLDKTLDPYSAVSVFTRESAAPNGVTAATTLIGEYR